MTVPAERTRPVLPLRPDQEVQAHSTETSPDAARQKAAEYLNQMVQKQNEILALLQTIHAEQDQQTQAKIQTSLEAFQEKFKQFEIREKQMQQYLEIPAALREFREVVLRLTALFNDTRLRGLAESINSNSDGKGGYGEFRSALEQFEYINEALKLDTGSASLLNVHEVNEAFSKCFHDGKIDRNFAKSYAAPLMRPFAQMFQHAYHNVTGMNPEVRKVILQGYHELVGAFSGIGLHFHDIRVLETKPNQRFHNERGIGCQDTLIKPIFEKRGKAKRLIPFVISDIIYLGYDSDVEGIESARSEVRIFYG